MTDDPGRIPAPSFEAVYEMRLLVEKRARLKKDTSLVKTETALGVLNQVDGLKKELREMRDRALMAEARLEGMEWNLKWEKGISESARQCRTEFAAMLQEAQGRAFDLRLKLQAAENRIHHLESKDTEDEAHGREAN